MRELLTQPLPNPLLKGEGKSIITIMDTPSLAPYTAQGEGWDEGEILRISLIYKI